MQHACYGLQNKTQKRDNFLAGSRIHLETDSLSSWRNIAIILTTRF
jgi:hypothetical protein